MVQWIVYKHTSIRSGKSYIGITRNSMKSRWQEHVRSALKGSSFHFHNAIRLYGVDNWTHEVMADKIDTLEEAYVLEKYHIKNEDTFENGYNLTVGGEGNPGLQKPEYFITYTWRHLTYGTEVCTALELIEKYPNLTIANFRPYFKNNWSSVFGWTHKEEVIPRNALTDFEKIIHVYSIDTNEEFIGTIKEFSVKIEKPISHISKFINGKYKSISGWTFTKEKVPVYNKQVQGFHAETNELVVTYPSAFEASRQLSLSRKELMCEWLGYSGQKGKLYNGIVYKYAKDTNIGVK